MNLEFEKGQGYSVEITHNINDFLISYQKIGFNELSLDKTDIKLLLERITKIASTLNVKPSQFLLELIPSHYAAACHVDKRGIVHLVLPIDIFKNHIAPPSRGIDDDYLIYHELMHAKDVLEGKDSSLGFIDIGKDFTEYLSGRLWDFSIEGRLQKSAKPHCSKQQSIDKVYDCLLDEFEIGNIDENTMKLLSKQVIAELCELTWGKELTHDETCALVKRALGKTRLDFKKTKS
jgi:hypothetical protein